HGKLRCKLNELAQRNRWELKYEDVSSAGPDHIKTFTQRAVVNGKPYANGVGKNKKEAKQIAAKNALEGLLNSAPEPVNINKQLFPSYVTQSNYICWLNEYGQKNRVNIRALESTTIGSTIITTCCKYVVGDKEYPPAYGITRKEAKEEAAKLVYHELCGSKTTGCNQSIQGKKKKKTCLFDNFFLFCKCSLTTFLCRFLKEYHSIKSLGKGAFGSVFRARKQLLEKDYAIKIISCKDKTRREVLVLANLDHPNIVRYFSCWLQDTGYKYMTKTLYHKIELIKGVDLLLLLFSSEVKINTKFLFIEMELCEGGTLRRWIHKKNIAPAENSRQRQSLEFARQILSGVEYIHSKKLIHRDLKPENILFGQDGNVRIGDFGLATQDNDDGELVERTEDSGTRSYMAPEQVGVNYDRKVDVFALGLIFFELFWRIGTGHERIKVCKTTCTIGERVNDVHIIKTMLSTKPEARPEASALKTELKRWTGTPEGNTDQGNLTV
uniref:Eukaryotic translation initiation factor 2-alpha kinase 2 n=1 Tax=Neogobius melanostomus TaxID=47308 RepID=A0A8C6SY56_9GOBI